MNSLLDPQNHLFELARTGRRLPHIILAIVLGFVFVLLAQLTGGTAALIIVLLLSVGPAGILTGDLTLETLLPDTALEQAIFLVLVFGPIFFIIWGWLALFEKRPLWTIGLERAGLWQKYARGVLIGLAMFVAAIGISAILGYISVEENGPQQRGVVALGGVALVFLGWMVQGAAEEALTRGWLLPVIGARYTPLLGVIISSIIFAIFHLFNPNLSVIAVVNLALFGVFTALYVLSEGSLWGVFGIHTAWNWAQGNLFGFEVSGGQSPGATLFDLAETGPDVITGGAFGPEGGLAVTLVLVASCIIVWRLAGPKNSPQAQ